MLQAKQLTKFIGAESILDNLSFVLNDAEHVGLIGPNGCGKTTLLRCIAGLDRPDSGDIILSPPNLSIGYLPQVMADMADLSVDEAIVRSHAEWRQAEVDMQSSLLELSDRPDDLAALDRYDEAMTRFEALGGYEREQRGHTILTGLGLDDSLLSRRVESLSGGQKTRLGLAMLLLREPDLLLLDEPTNHLDIDALVWLEEFVKTFRGAVLVVSHDREFLDRTVSRILYFDPRGRNVLSYEGNYSDFAAAREAEAESLRATWVQQEKYVRKVASDIARLKGEALDIELSTTPRQPGVRRLARKKAGLAKSREKKLDRFLESDEYVDRPRQDWSLHLDFGDPPPAGRSVLHVENLAFGFGGEASVFSGINVDLQYGDRLAVIGPNGSGKTTLIRLITGALEPTYGSVELGTGVRLGLLAQEQETLDGERSVLDTALRERPMTQTEARGFLHYFLFTGDDVFRPVGRCSPGERARLQLALLMLRGCNLLVLDEPLNHLDIEGREHFQQSLAAFEGTVIAVVHDRAFLREFDAPLLWLAEGKARRFADYAQWESRGARS
jgi:ATP-binding cassette, subfamily F, member 3